MRLYLLVSVYQNGKQIVKSSAISIEPPGLLSDLLKLALSTNDIPNVNISVDFQKDNSKDWHIILKGIQENLEILIFLNATHIRFIWNDDYDDINNSQAEIHKNAFNILMSNATNIHFPLAQGLTTRNNLLYNHVIDLLRIQNLGGLGTLTQLLGYKELPEYKAKALENSLIQPWASDKKWEQFIDEVIQLCATSKKYVEYLDNVNNRMRIIHSSSIPIRNGIDHIKVLLDINKTSSMSNKYTDIINLMQDKAEYDPICIDYLIPHNVFQAAYLEVMELPFNITLYRYYSGNYIGTLNWICKRPDTVELFDKTKESQSLLKAHESLPKYSTRQMRKNVINKYSLYTRLSPAILLQECIKLMYETQDPNIVFDLRKNGGFKGTKFDEFLNEMDAYFNEVIAISIQELRESIIERLKAKHDEEKFSTISVPSNDKHKVPIREIVETSTGVRNKATLAFADMELTSCDHNFTKLSITPSVSLLCNIPKDISESFYQGQCLREKYTILPEMLVIYTDGGADHQTTFGSVQLAMICLFLEGDFDF
ncbi:hypothetical protein GLOIN_2v1769956 [Rhizophagus irregularis DAOM 181602=DAOM 197198]|uniref:Uncharacterized protein n=1 Tax=Rhizophagus irregularis (strain DAOM 181602 / DAOM 197198 / MUCL 43194) TaxID=747089 RepID=A0A2P4QDL9_RHIID|nr:hypothetical protein GLOIN_2v1769956 [Rhizophagus irregularis DAOM 181602=DAOM 197198]POG75717.1 hypothetical protein GLOIN_2v1769956 [Rhizophagus irregularis DAOM 181602=DAOM 197198]|eukprot:XP_025182583.1 hypothetical protein GLOIN_2v1769956 [Rhizophagus irregularis DAOM 181602=DAOM 197198]